MKAIIRKHTINAAAVAAFVVALSGFAVPSSLSTKAAIVSVSALIGSVIGTVKADEAIANATRVALPYYPD